MSLLVENGNDLADNDLGDSGGRRAALGAAVGPVDPALAAVIDAWPTLPEFAKAAILAVLGAAEPKE